MLTRKDFQAAAEIVKNARERAEDRQDPWIGAVDAELQDVAESLAGWFASDNPRFSREVFLDACRPAPESVRQFRRDEMRLYETQQESQKDGPAEQ